jgi:Gluconate 2-dehydrogenase subunit 3
MTGYTMSRPPMSRRRALKALGTGAGAVGLLPWLSDEGLAALVATQKAAAKKGAAAPELKVLTRAQYASLDALADAIIPTDERSPGAREARVAEYIDLLLSEQEEARPDWIAGLESLDAEATKRFQAPLSKLPAAQMETLLTDISRNEKVPESQQTPLEKFFVLTKNATIVGYYTSEIGIHQDLHYQGNQYVPNFLGCLTVDGKDCPYCGQKAEPASATNAQKEQ